MRTLGDPHPNVRLFDITKVFCTFRIKLISNMKYLLTLMAIIALSCNSSTQQGDFEEKARQYMKDSVVPTFHDPSSYEFVSVKVDTLTGSDYLKNLKKGYIDTDTSLLGSGVYNEKNKKIQELSAVPGYNDSILHVNLEVSYRGKNKMGALVLKNKSLVYLPKEDRITLLENLGSRY